MSHRRLRVTFVGFMPFWSNVLTEVLMARHTDELDCRWLEWPSTLTGRFALVLAVVRSDVIVRVGMPFEFESETNRVWLRMMHLLGKRGVNYWLGSDVMQYAERVRTGATQATDERAVRQLVHLGGTDELTGRLVALGIPAATVVMPSPDRAVPDVPPPLPADFRVLAYWGADRIDFYGGRDVLRAAAALPDVAFDVLGDDGSGVADAPANVTFHGRVADVGPYYERATVLVRLVQHDSVPASMVEEAMLFGRYVVYSFEWPHTIRVASGDSDGLIAALGVLRERHEQGLLAPNVAGQAFAREDWDQDKRAAALRDALTAMVRRPRKADAPKG